MANCANEPLDIGRKLIVLWAEGCGTDDPTTAGSLTYKPLGYTTTKAMNETTRTTSANNDTSGAFEKELQTGLGIEIPVSVFTAKDIADVSTQVELRNYRRSEIIAGRQASVWLKLVNQQEGVEELIFCNVNDVSRSYENEGTNSGDFNFKMVDTGVASNPAYQTQPIV